MHEYNVLIKSALQGILASYRRKKMEDAMQQICKKCSFMCSFCALKISDVKQLDESAKLIAKVNIWTVMKSLYHHFTMKYHYEH